MAPVTTEQYIDLLRQLHKLRVLQARLPNHIAGLELKRVKMERVLELDGRKRKSPNGSREREVMALLPAYVSEIRAVTDMSENQIRIILKRAEAKDWVKQIGKNPALWVRRSPDETVTQ